MELEDWEYLSHSTLSNSQIIEDQDHQHQGDEQVKEFTEISEAKEAMEVESEEESSELEEAAACMESNGNESVINGFNQRTQNWRLRGIGIAAATLSMLLLGGCKRGHSRELQMQIYADDKGMKQAAQSPARLGHVLSAVRGGPATGAYVSFGGYYQGL